MGSANEYDIEEPKLAVDGDTIEDIRGTLRLLRTDRGLLARVEASSEMDTRCSRCAAGVRASVPISFEEEYVPILDAHTGESIRLAPDDEAFRIDERFDLDLREALRQYILISEPVKPLCNPDCAGLCPVCGADLNEGPHECEQPPDERWNLLAELKKGLEEGN
ncbi:MAG: DUF177 domain-containing protein [Dehalococcoidia bacterium]